jgi:hypothetical protein
LLHYYGEFARKEDMLVEIDASPGMGSGMGNKEQESIVIDIGGLSAVLKKVLWHYS